MGHSPIDHRILSANNSTRRSLHAIFDGDTCRACTMLDQCPVRAPNHRDKGCSHRETIGNFRLEITAELRLRDEMYTLQKTTEWKDRYKIRSGIEGTNSELKRAHGIGRLRVRRLAKVCFVVACKIIACNIKRWAKAHRAFMRLLRGRISQFCGLFEDVLAGPAVMVASLRNNVLSGASIMIMKAITSQESNVNVDICSLTCHFLIMSRKTRIDAVGALHHVIVRGIERSAIFKDDRDRKEFLTRLGTLLRETSTSCYAWALMNNHVHLLLRSGLSPLSSLMRRLLTGYAQYFNRRYDRSDLIW